MIIRKLDIVSFGKFKNLEIPLDKGINLFYGENEAGKSTIQDFIGGTFYGFTDPTVGSKRKYLPEQAKYKPWDCERYFGVMEYSLDDNDYRIERNFDSDGPRINIYKNGIDVTNLYPQNKRKEREFAEEHLGLGIRVFKNTISINQLSTKTEDNLIDEIRTKLINLKTSGSEDLSIERAKRAIDKQLDTIGTDKASKKEYGATLLAIKELENQMVKAIEQNKKLEELGLKLDSKRRELRRLDSLRANVKLAKVGDYKKRLEVLEEELGDFVALAEVNIKDRDNIVDRLAEIEFLSKDISNLQGQRDQLIKKQEELEQRLEHYKAYSYIEDKDISNLNIYYHNIQESNKEMEKTKRDIKECNANMEPLENIISRGFSEESQQVIDHYQDQFSGYGDNYLDSQIKEYRDSHRKSSIVGNRYRNIYLLSMIFTIIAIFAAFIKPEILIASMITGLTGVITLIKYRKLKSRIREYEKKILDLEVEVKNSKGSLIELGNKVKEILAMANCSTILEYKQSLRNHNSTVKELEHYREKVNIYTQKLNDEIDKVEKIKGYIKDILKRLCLPEMNYNLQFLKERIEADYTNYKALSVQIDQLSQRLVDIEGDIEKKTERINFFQQGISQSIGIEGLNGKGYLQYCKDYEKYLEVQSLTNLINEIIGKDTIDSLKTQSQQVDSRLIGSQFNSIEEDITTLSREIMAIEEEIRFINGQELDLASLEEMLELEKRKKECLEINKKALGIAYEKINDISAKIHRDFTPILNTHLKNAMEIITSGKYTNIKTREDLNIVVEVPSLKEMKEAEAFSKGTIDQLYFGLRIGLSKLISRGKNLPLILDDTFVNYDDRRMTQALRYLAEISRERQIILFTCHKREKEILDSIGVRYNYIEL